MEFFVRHYEKLLLAICLIVLCIAIWQVNENKKVNLAEASQQKATATEKAQVKGEKAVPPLDASKLAALFGGGGHRQAAGCTIYEPMEEAKKTFLETLARWREETT